MVYIHMKASCGPLLASHKSYQDGRLTPLKAHLGVWIRARTFEGFGKDGPSWSHLVRGLTRDMHTHCVLDSLDCDGLSKLALHRSCLPECSWDTSTTRDVEPIFFNRMDPFHVYGCPFNDQLGNLRPGGGGRGQTHAQTREGCL